MEREQTKSASVRKAYARKGERSQVMMSFRLDNENAEWLKQQLNKGRYINELIAAARAKGAD